MVWSSPFFRQREVRDGGGYGQQGQCYEVMYGFEHMQSERLSPDAITFICTLKACRSTETMHIGEQIHDRIMSTQLLEGDIVLGTTLVDMYVKCGMLAKAEKVLKGLPDRNTISWACSLLGILSIIKFMKL